MGCLEVQSLSWSLAPEVLSVLRVWLLASHKSSVSQRRIPGRLTSPRAASGQAATAEMEDNSKHCWYGYGHISHHSYSFYLYFSNLNLYKHIIAGMVCFVKHCWLRIANIIYFFKLGLIFIENQGKTKMNKIYWLPLLFFFMNCHWHD